MRRRQEEPCRVSAVAHYQFVNDVFDQVAVLADDADELHAVGYELLNQGI